MLGRVFLGRYETIRLLGEGGMGRVYLARQLDLGRQVVVKVMHDHIVSDPTFRERFAREMHAMARFQHPYAVTLYDASRPNDPECPCIVMEYIRGITLDTLLGRNGRLGPARVGRLLYQMCEVLQAAHAQGIIHRDLKPANLMVVDPDTPHELLKVMDFGLAKLVSHGAFHPTTVTNMDFAVGTPGYMCPEQARGEEMDHRGDLYSVGVVLYELLTGRLPFGGASTMEVLLAQVTEEAPSFAEIGLSGGISPAIEEVVQCCLAKEADLRPPNARALAQMYEDALGSEHALGSIRGRAPKQPLRSSGALDSHQGKGCSLTQQEKACQIPQADGFRHPFIQGAPAPRGQTWEELAPQAPEPRARKQEPSPQGKGWRNRVAQDAAAQAANNEEVRAPHGTPPRQPGPGEMHDDVDPDGLGGAKPPRSPSPGGSGREELEPAVPYSDIPVSDQPTLFRPAVADPQAVVHQIDAWMPEGIASFKLYGFVQDMGGEVAESSPGRIRVRIGGQGSVYAVPASTSGLALGWLGFGRKSRQIEMELRLQRAEGGRNNQLRITVVFRSPNGEVSRSPAWQRVCNQIFCDLRAYLMGRSQPANAEATTERL